MKTEQRRKKARQQRALRGEAAAATRNSIVELFKREQAGRSVPKKGKYNFVRHLLLKTCIIQRTNVNKTVDGRSS